MIKTNKTVKSSIPSEREAGIERIVNKNSLEVFEEIVNSISKFSYLEISLAFKFLEEPSLSFPDGLVVVFSKEVAERNTFLTYICVVSLNNIETFAMIESKTKEDCLLINNHLTSELSFI